MLFEAVTGEILGAHLLLDDDYASGLAAICVVDRAKRVAIYNEVVAQIADRVMPSISDFDSIVPNHIRDPLEALYGEMCHLDYRKRLVDFRRIFRRVDTILLMLERRDNYLRWKAAQAARRVAAQQ